MIHTVKEDCSMQAGLLSGDTVLGEEMQVCTRGVPSCGAQSQVKGTGSTPALLLCCSTCWDGYPYPLWAVSVKTPKCLLSPRLEVIKLIYVSEGPIKGIALVMMWSSGRPECLASLLWLRGCEVGFLMRTNSCLSPKFSCLVFLSWTKAVLIFHWCLE